MIGEEERADVLAYLARRQANCDLVARKSPEFADDAKVQKRQLGILIDEIRGGMHEGESSALASSSGGVMGPRPATGRYPFREHRTLSDPGTDPDSPSEAVVPSAHHVEA